MSQTCPFRPHAMSSSPSSHLSPRQHPAQVEGPQELPASILCSQPATTAVTAIIIKKRIVDVFFMTTSWDEEERPIGQCVEFHPVEIGDTARYLRESN
jgi:hypothetical protein